MDAGLGGETGTVRWLARVRWLTAAPDSSASGRDLVGRRQPPALELELDGLERRGPHDLVAPVSAHDLPVCSGVRAAVYLFRDTLCWPGRCTPASGTGRQPDPGARQGVVPRKDGRP